MGCVASAVASREKNKTKVQPVPSPKVLRGDLISRSEAKQRRNKMIVVHHAKANKLAQTIAYNTVVEKEMMSTTSTERSYRSGRGFLISATATGPADTNASEQGSSSTVSDGAIKPGQEVAPAKSKTDPANKTATRLPYSVPEEESLHCHSNGDVGGQGQEVVLQGSVTKGQGIDQDRTPDLWDVNSKERIQEEKTIIGSNSDSSADMNFDGHQSKGEEDDSDPKVSRPDGDGHAKVKKPGRVRFEEECRTPVVSELQKENRELEQERTVKPKENDSAASSDSQPAG